MKRIILITLGIIPYLIVSTILSAANYKIETISDNMFFVADSAGGEKQLVIKSDSGLIVFNTFWSGITARNFKAGISAHLNRNDFVYTINLVDRLDMFGGNAAYKETRIIGHESFADKYLGREKEVEAEIKQLIDMWRWKEDVSRQRLATHEKGSEEAGNEERWMRTCKQRADELEAGFSLVLPSIFYSDRMTLGLGDLSLKLIWFGKAGNYNGMSVAVIPKEKTAVIPGFILHPQHLAPYPYSEYAQLDVQRWIAVLQEILEGEQAVERVICGSGDVWSRERAHTHLEYIRKLWNSVKTAEAAGKDLDEVQDQFSLDNDFAFVKEMQVYRDHGDDWVRPQHRSHVRVFYLQHKILAAEMINTVGMDSLLASFATIRNLRQSGSTIYFDEASFNGIGYRLLAAKKIPEAIEVFKFNVELFPKSYNVYDSLGEAYMQSGDKENAALNYKKSLELNPENNNAREMLKTMEGK
jgi:tetratricopeptide (TPR) repeat protein